MNSARSPVDFDIILLSELRAEMSKIFDNIETKFEEGLHAIPGSRNHTGLLKVGNMSFMSPKKAFDNRQSMR